jgi:hypothetical protein
MATYYGVNASGNWNTAATWSTVATKSALRTGATGATPTASDDCILDDWTSNGGGIVITVDNTACVCKTLVCTGYAGELAFTATKQLSVSGNVTFASTHTLSGTGTLRVLANASITMGTLTFPGSVTLSGYTYTLTEALNITGTLIFISSATIAGAFSISCGTLSLNVSTVATLSFVAGQTLTISTAINLSQAMFGAVTIKSNTPGTNTTITYNGLASACKIAGVTFTDVTASASAVTLYNWYGAGVDDAAKKIVIVDSTDIGTGGGAVVGPFEVGPFR